uniref:WASH complex subunit 1 n=1 Tax=Elaeis guineensis var. tenera TaxID=51953 RepID=A0A6J0PQJ5_ELAGV|nr:WASH complex subunit 1 [Elaeis guineensis]
MKRKREEKRRKFHQALLNLYHPPPPPPPPPPPVTAPQLAEEDSVAMVSGCIDLDLDPEDADNVEKESSPSGTGELVPQKLTRAQRKRIRKRKLKEAASVRRKFVGPLLPSAYQNLEDETSCKAVEGKIM